MIARTLRIDEAAVSPLLEIGDRKLMRLLTGTQPAKPAPGDPEPIGSDPAYADRLPSTAASPARPSRPSFA